MFQVVWLQKMVVILNAAKENFASKLHSVIVEEVIRVKHFNWRDFKVGLSYIIEVSV